ncbi:hypothetical protein OAP14_07680 [Aliiglaciecola sp.]|nr:hypothetical protein [Aliiglaciecola sp.]
MDLRFFKRKLSVAFFIVLAVVVYILSLDEKAQAEAVALIETINNEVSVENNGTVYLLGMWTSQQNSPYQVGLERIKNFNMRRSLPNEDAYDALEVSYSELWLDEIDPVTTSPMTCHYQDKECLDFVWRNTSLIPNVLIEYDLYINRLNQLLKFKTFKVATKPHFSVPMPFHQASLFSIRLKLLEVIHFTKSKEYSKAAKELSELIDLNLNLLENTPDLFTKVLAVIHHQETLNVATFLLTKTPQDQVEHWSGAIDMAAKFKTKAASTKRQMGVEFVAFENAIQEHPSFSDFYQESSMQLIPQFMLYKPNMTLNLLYETFMKKVDLYDWNEEMIKLKKALGEENEPPPLQLTNFIGSTLVTIAAPRYLYIERDILELFFKNELYKASYKERLSNESPNFQALNIKSPYTGRPFFQKGSRLCVDGANNESEPICFYY